MKKELTFEIGEIYEVSNFYFVVVGVIHDDELVFGHILNETGNGKPMEYKHKFSEVNSQWYKP